MLNYFPFQSRNFWLVICDAVWQSLVMYFIPHFAYVDSDIGIWELGSGMAIMVEFVYGSICVW